MNAFKTELPSYNPFGIITEEDYQRERERLLQEQKELEQNSRIEYIEGENFQVKKLKVYGMFQCQHERNL